MKKRLFIGIKAGYNLVEEVHKWRGNYIKKVDVRWTKDKNFHITLLPPWYEDEVGQAIRRLNDLKLNIKPFLVRFEKVGLGPDPKRPRLIWAKGKKPKEFGYLENYLAEFLQKKPQRRANYIHLTLARFNPRDFSKFSIKKIEDSISWKSKIDCISLFESKLKRTGSDYRVLKKHKLNF
jgi:2'-5' RNA ligase